MKILAFALLLGACSVTPTYDTGTLVWVGCHTVQQNPSPEGSTGYMMLRHLVKGESLYLQQIDKTGRSDVTIGEPCR